jgi:hypothetical protein
VGCVEWRASWVTGWVMHSMGRHHGYIMVPSHAILYTLYLWALGPLLHTIRPCCHGRTQPCPPTPTHLLNCIMTGAGGGACAAGGAVQQCGGSQQRGSDPPAEAAGRQGGSPAAGEAPLGCGFTPAPSLPAPAYSHALWPPPLDGSQCTPGGEPFVLPGAWPPRIPPQVTARPCILAAPRPYHTRLPSTVCASPPPPFSPPPHSCSLPRWRRCVRAGSWPRCRRGWPPRRRSWRGSRQTCSDSWQQGQRTWGHGRPPSQQQRRACSSSRWVQEGPGVEGVCATAVGVRLEQFCLKDAVCMSRHQPHMLLLQPFALPSSACCSVPLPSILLSTHCPPPVPSPHVCALRPLPPPQEALRAETSKLAARQAALADNERRATEAAAVRNGGGSGWRGWGHRGVMTVLGRYQVPCPELYSRVV